MISKAASTSTNLRNVLTWWTSPSNATYKKENDKEEKPKCTPKTLMPFGGQ
jgi:hypothetical protein